MNKLWCRGISEERFTAQIQEDYDDGTRIGIRGTPGNILLHNASGEVSPIPGAVPVEALSQSVDRSLGESG